MTSCESLDMLSLGLSHKNLLAPLLVSKQSVSPGPSVSLCSYLMYLHLPPALHFLPALLFPHLSRPFKPLYFVDPSKFLPVCPIFFLPVFMPSMSPPLAFVNFILVLIIPLLCSTFFFVFSVSRSTFNYFSRLLSSPLLFCGLLPDATHSYSNLSVRLSFLLPLLSAVLPLICGNMRSIPTTLRLTGV